jgi:hypothetical protein
MVLFSHAMLPYIFEINKITHTPLYIYICKQNVFSMNYFDNQLHMNVSYIRLTHLGIQHKKLAPHSPQQNKVIEWMN